MRARRGTLTIILASEAFMLAMIALALSQGNAYALNGAVMGALILTLPFILETIGWFKMPVFMQVWATLSIGLHTLGLVMGLYDDTWWWDEMTHFVSSSLVGMITVLALYLLDIHSLKIKVPRWAYPLMILVFSIFIGVVWEIGEFIGDVLAGTRMQYSLIDTLGDVYVNMLGGLAASVVWVLWLWKDSEGDLAGSAQGPLVQMFDRAF